MAQQLDYEIALRLARSLKSIKGFPFDEEVVKATAEDLVYWCKGTFLDGQPWSPEDQAHWTVTEARRNWGEWKGTGALLKLFRSKFETDQLSNPRLDPVPYICSACSDSGTIVLENGKHAWCRCRVARSIYVGEPDLIDRLDGPAPEAPPPTVREVADSSGMPGTRNRRTPIRRPLTEADQQRAFEARQANVERQIADARAILEDPDASQERREIAVETLCTLGASEHKTSRATHRRLRSRPRIR